MSLVISIISFGLFCLFIFFQFWIFFWGSALEPQVQGSSSTSSLVLSLLVMSNGYDYDKIYLLNKTKYYLATLPTNLRNRVL